MNIYVVLPGALADAQSVVASAGGGVYVADSRFPASNLFSADPDAPCVWTGLAANGRVRADLAVWGNGNLNSWAGGLPASPWVVTLTGAGTCIQETGAVRSGSSMRLSTGGVYPTNSAMAQITRTLRAGWAYTFDCWGQPSDGTAPCKAFVQNLYTGNYLQSNGTWSSSANPVGTAATGAFTQLGRAFTMESFLACGAFDVPVQVTCTGTGGLFQNYYFEDVDIRPAWDTMFIHGWGGYTAGQTNNIMTSTDGSSWSDIVTISKLQPSYGYRFAAPRTERYVGFEMYGTAYSTPWLGKLIVGLSVAIATAPNFGLRMRHTWAQIRNRTRAGASRVYNQGRTPTRTLELDADHVGIAQYQQVRDQIYLATRGGADPFVLIAPAYDTDSASTTEVWMYCRIPDGQLEAQRGSAMIWPQRLTFVEEPFPNVTS